MYDEIFYFNELLLRFIGIASESIAYGGISEERLDAMTLEERIETTKELARSNCRLACFDAGLAVASLLNDEEDESKNDDSPIYDAIGMLYGLLEMNVVYGGIF